MEERKPDVPQMFFSYLKTLTICMFIMGVLNSSVALELIKYTFEGVVCKPIN